MRSELNGRDGLDIYIHGASIGTDDWTCTIYVIRYSGVGFMDYRRLYRHCLVMHFLRWAVFFFWGNVFGCPWDRDSIDDAL